MVREPWLATSTCPRGSTRAIGTTSKFCRRDEGQIGSLAVGSATRTLDGPLGVVGAGYIGHLFAQQFALAGYEVRAWSPARSVHTLDDRLRQSVSTLAEIGAVDPSDVDDVLARVSTHD